MKNIIILALILGCGPDPYKKQDIYGCTVEGASNFDPAATIFDDSCEFGEFLEVEWIYYGNDESMTGCYWTGITFPNQTIGSEDIGMFQFQDSNENVHNVLCDSFGQTDYIRHFTEENYFFIPSQDQIYEQNYETFVYEYMIIASPNYDAPSK